MLDSVSVGKSKKMHATPLRAAPFLAGLGAVFALASPDAQASGLATVVSSTPVTASVAVPRQVCSDGAQIVQQRPSGAGAVIGAIAGGVIGHQFGGGFGRAAATGVGAFTGAVVGDQVEAANAPVTEVPVRRCQTSTTYENRVIGYDVVYEYAGQRYSTRMGRDPGTQLAVSVQPAEAGSLPAPADAGQIGTPVPSNAGAPQTVYYAPYYAPAPAYAPGYYYGPSVYVAPVIGFGFGYYGGGHHRRWR
jgi:uncharacterized protein YcfJ